MFRLALKNLSENAIRITLTGFAIVLGVAFVVSSFVLRDGLSESFESLSAEIVQGTDLQVSGLDDERLTDADLATLNAEPGVRVAEGSISAFEHSELLFENGNCRVGVAPVDVAFGVAQRDCLPLIDVLVPESDAVDHRNLGCSVE